MKRIKLTKGKYTVVDNDMYELLRKYNWSVSYYNNKRLAYAKKYVALNGKGGTEALHWYIIGQPLKGFVVDHINGNGLDNRRINLRIITKRENSLNRYIHRDGKLYGAYYDKSVSFWKAQIRIDGKSKTIGNYKTELEAHLAYKRALEAYYEEN